MKDSDGWMKIGISKDVEGKAVHIASAPEGSAVYVNGARWPRHDNDPEEFGDTDDDRAKYYYEEHTCPTNIMRDVEVVIDGDDPDPHGLFDYVGRIDNDDALKARVLEMFPGRTYCRNINNLSYGQLCDLMGGLLEDGDD